MPHPAALCGARPRTLSPGRTLVALLVVGVLVAIGATACRRGGDDDPHRKIQVLVVSRVVPQGKLVAAAMNDGSFTLTEVPADVAPADALTEVNDLRCLVVGQSLPNGTIVRRSFLVEPSRIGLDRGLTDGTARPQGCD